MSATTIEWTEETWNPIRARLLSDPSRIGWHCEHASPGCEHCYAETRNRSGRCNMGTKLPFKPGHRKDVEIFLDEETLLKPLHWRRPRKIFVCSMTDLFAGFVADEWLDRIFAVMALCPQHTFQLLTKRADRMRAFMCGLPGRPIGKLVDNILRNSPPRKIWPSQNFEREDGWRPGALRLPLPNVWLGVTVEDQQRADERIPDLLATPAAVRWLSMEPLLGPVDLIGEEQDGPLRDGEPRDWNDPMQIRYGGPRLDWIALGGESGPGARPMHPDWARSVRDQCAAAGVPFLFKQWGSFAPCELKDDGGGGVSFNPPLDAKSLRKARRWEGDVLRPETPRAAIGGFFAPGMLAIKVGKKEAGRLLDGVLHDAYPETAHD